MPLVVKVVVPIVAVDALALTCPAVVVTRLVEFPVSIPLVLLKESAMPSIRMVVVACSVEDAVRRDWRVMFFCESKSPATRPEVLKAQVPPMAKHPLERFIPFAKVDVAVVEVRLR